MKITIVGGGLAGLMAARSACLRYPDSQVTIIERSSHTGGLLAGKVYESHGLYFDLGTHIFRETGNGDIDNFILGSIPKAFLTHFEVGRGDLAGAIFNGKLQSNTHFPDIRDHADVEALTQSLLKHLETSACIPDVSRIEPFLSHSNQRFGDLYTHQILAPLLSNLYQRSAESLASFAYLLPGLTRVVAMDSIDWHAHSGSDHYRKIFAFHDQRQLPTLYQQKKRSFYSRHQGSSAFIKGISASLVSDGVKILTNTTIGSIDLKKRSMICTHPSGKSFEIASDALVLATGVVGAAHLLGLDMKAFDFDSPIEHKVVNLTVKDTVESDLCYFYGLDLDLDFYRVTNYRAFSGDTHDKRLSIEVLGKSDICDQGLPRHLVQQLHRCGFLSSDRFEFSDVVQLKHGFPVPTIKNMTSLTLLWQKIDALLPSEIICGGIGTDGGLFFQNEIVENIYHKVSQLPAFSNFSSHLSDRYVLSS